MKVFLHYFFGIMDQEDKRGFKKYIVVLFLGSVFSVFGIGAIIPFINILIQPESTMSLSFFHGWSYIQVVVFFTTLLIVAFAIKNMMATFLVGYQYRYLSSLVAKVQKKLFTGYLALDYEYHLNRNTPDLIKNINNETTLLSSEIISPLGIFLSDLFSSIFVLILLLALKPIFTILVSIFLISGIFFFMKTIKQRIEFHAESRTKAWSEMTKNVLSGFLGIKESKLYHCEKYFSQTFDRDVVRLKEAGIFHQTYSEIPRMLIEFIGVMVVMSVLCGFILAGSSTQELFVLLGVFGVAAAQLLPGLTRLTRSTVKIKYAMPALMTVYNELKQIKAATASQSSVRKALKKVTLSSKVQVKEVHYRYQDGTKALNGIDLEIPKNKKIAFVGESGAGKTTLVDLLMGLYRPSQGRIYLDDKPLVSEEDIVSFQKLFAYVPQNIVLYDTSIRHNVAFGVVDDVIDDDRVWHCLAQAHMKTFVETLKDKESTFIGEGGVRLSGGQRQRIGIARALYRQPQILVMDEATSALDNQTEKEITSVLSTLNDLTMITIAHRLSTVKHYDLIYLMKNGKVVASGTYDQLVDNCLMFRDMVNVVN